MRICTCIGNYSKTPYVIEASGTPVYCIEELAWVLKEYAYYLDNTIVNEEVVLWIRNELGLKNLADNLMALVRANASVGTFIMEILRFTQFFDDEAMKDTEIILRKNAGMTLYEKKKSMYDAFQNSGKIMAALEGYDEILSDAESKKSKDYKFLASIHNNKGVALTRLFLFEEAAVEFKKAYEIYPEDEYLVSYLAAIRIISSDSDYLAYIENIDNKEVINAVMDRFEKVSILLPNEREYIANEARAKLRYEGGSTEYYDKNKEVIDELTVNYRRMMLGE